jgi:Holliday junction resolvase RusA-like endonuclease
MIRFVIPGAPRTKKNSSMLSFRGRAPRMLPSKAFREWNKQAQICLMLIHGELGGSPLLPLMVPVNCRALFFLDRDWRGDAVGYYQALADALEEGGIVENDRLITQWDGSRVMVDAANPRIEVELYEPV